MTESPLSRSWYAMLTSRYHANFEYPTKADRSRDNYSEFTDVSSPYGYRETLYLISTRFIRIGVRDIQVDV